MDETLKKKEQVIIKQVTKHNFFSFLNLIDELAKYEKLKAPTKDAKVRLKKDCLDKKLFKAYLAYSNEKPVGYCIYYFTYSSFLALKTFYLEDIFVLEEFRGSGIGSQLFNFCSSIAKKEGCSRMDWVVLNWNKSAIKFYKKRNAKALQWIYFRLERKYF